MECPNKCGEIQTIKEPSLIPILAEVEEYTDVEYDDNDGEFPIPMFRLILRICTECGYYESMSLTQEMFELHTKGKLLTG